MGIYASGGKTHEFWMLFWFRFTENISQARDEFFCIKFFLPFKDIKATGGGKKELFIRNSLVMRVHTRSSPSTKTLKKLKIFQARFEIHFMSKNLGITVV